MLSDHPPPSAIHLPHQQYPTSSALNLRSPPPSRSQSQARSNMHPRFSALTPAADPDPSSLALRHRKAAEKAKFYDRAFQRSTLLASSTLPGSNTRRNGPGTRFEGGRIDEESRLDGESFVAPTEEMPFGLVDSVQDRQAEGEVRSQVMPNSNLQALVGELYRR